MGDQDTEDIKVERNTGTGELVAKMLQSIDPPREYRLSVRLTPEEYARIEHWRQVFQSRAKGYYTATQKTVLLEALDALDYRENERIRKSKKGSS